MVTIPRSSTIDCPGDCGVGWTGQSSGTRPGKFSCVPLEVVADH